MHRRVFLATVCLLLVAGLYAGGRTETKKMKEEQSGTGKMKDEKASAPQSRIFINIGSGGTAGTYFPLAGGLADIWNKNVAGVNATAQSTGASVANINLLRTGKVDVIFVQNDTAYYAYQGKEVFKDKAYSDLRGLLTMYPETVQIVTLEKSGIKTVADVRGRRVAVGAPGSGVEANARQILQATGLTYDDIKPQYLSFSEAASNLKDGNIDVAFLTAGHPTAAVQDISAQHKLVLVDIDKATREKLLKQYPYYTETQIPAGTYNGVDRATETVSVKAMLAVDAKLDAGLVKELLQQMFSHTDRLVAAHKKGALITKETALDGMSIPLHPGAEQFFAKG